MHAWHPPLFFKKFAYFSTFVNPARGFLRRIAAGRLKVARVRTDLCVWIDFS